MAELTTDVLIVGAGGAGARAAIQAAEAGVRATLVSKGPLARSGITPLAQWSLEAAMAHEDTQDSPEQHFKDIIREGRSLSDQTLARALADESPARVLDLERFGVPFHKRDGKFRQMATPGQSFPRSVQIRGGGHAMMLGLKREVLRQQGIDLREDFVVTRLLKNGDRVIGAMGVDLRTGEILPISAKAVILATGGNEELWPMTDTPPESIGDGFYLAYHAGAILLDLELLLYYPVVASFPASIAGTIIPYEVTLEPKFCGGALLNGRGESFLPSGKLPARDVMIDLIFREIKAGRGTANGGVFLDISRSPKALAEIEAILQELIPEVTAYLRHLGVDIASQRVEIVPAAHYTLGGVQIDEHGRTTVAGLYAAGECAANVQGANRSSGNALAETQVFGQRAGLKAAEYALARTGTALADEQVREEIYRLEAFFTPKTAAIRPQQFKSGIRTIVGEYLGYGRSATGLATAGQQLKELKENLLPRIDVPAIRQYNLDWLEAIEAAMMADVALLVAEAAGLREETRGHHYRTDFPTTDNRNWLRHTTLYQSGRQLITGASPVIVTDIPIPVEEE